MPIVVAINSAFGEGKGDTLRLLLIQLPEVTEVTVAKTAEPAAGWDLVSVFVAILMIFIFFGAAWFAWSLRERGLGPGRAWLDYGPFFMVALGIVAALVGFLVTVLVFVRPEEGADLTDVLALLAALFGIIGTLVGTYFGIRSTLDVNEGVMRLALGETSLTVIAVTPRENADDVDVANPNVTATFSRAVNPASITQQTFDLVSLPNRDSVPGNHSFEAQNTRVAFTPSTTLAADTTYQATITTDITDQSGQKLVSEKTWTFTTPENGEESSA